MRGKKAKAIRRQATLMMNGKTRTPVDYEEISHPVKYRADVQINPETKVLEPIRIPYNPRQLVVKSRWDIIVNALKKAYNQEMRSGNSLNLIHTA